MSSLFSLIFTCDLTASRGLAGAGRLAEDPSITGLTSSRGLERPFPSLNWAYATIPQEHLGNRQLVIGAGKPWEEAPFVRTIHFHKPRN